MNSVSNGSGFGPEKWFGSVPEPSKNPTRSVMVGQTRTRTRQPAGFAGPSVPISSFVFRVFLFMVAFRYPTANRKILTFAGDCPVRMNRPPLSLKTRDTCSVPHPEHDSHRRVKDFWSCFISNLGGDWMQTIINEVLAVFQTKRDSNTLLAPF